MIDSEFYKKDFEKYTELEIMHLLNIQRAGVEMFFPEAKLMYTTNRKGERTHLGVYNCVIDLDEKGNFRKEQHAPQLLGKLHEHRRTEVWDEELVYHFSVWAHAQEYCLENRSMLREELVQKRILKPEILG